MCAIFRWRPSWITQWRHFNNFENASRRDHTYKVWGPLAKQFGRRSWLNMSKVTNTMMDFWPFGGHLGWRNHPILTKNAQESSPRRYLPFDIWHDHLRPKVQFDLHLTTWAMPIFDTGVTVLANLEEHLWSIIPTKFSQNWIIGSWEAEFLRICAVFRRRPSWITSIWRLLANLKRLHPRTMYVKFGDHWPSGSVEDDDWKSGKKKKSATNKKSATKIYFFDHFFLLYEKKIPKHLDQKWRFYYINLHRR
jgi:hypothetical protein